MKFCKSEEELASVLSILQDFETVSGLKVNMNKSGLISATSSKLINTLHEFDYLGIHYVNGSRSDTNITKKMIKATNAYLPFIKGKPGLLKARYFNNFINFLFFLLR